MDKLIHFLAGAVIFAAFFPVADPFTCSVIVAAAAVARETLNATGFDWDDLWTTVIGGGAMFVWYIILAQLVRL